MIRTNPVQYMQQVRVEVAKVVWPTRKEVLLTTVMVFVMSAVTAVFFAIIDIMIRGGLQQVLGFFG
jgi:preprotein translocase subunit SecE